MRITVVFLCALALIIASKVIAKPMQLDFCADEKITGWSFYCDPALQEEEPPQEVALPPAIPPQQPMTATEEIMAFRAHVDEIKYRAVLNPTEENVIAYMELNAEIARKAGHFTDQWQRVLFKTPELDANVKKPLAAAGITVFQDQMNAVQDAVFRRVAENNGLMFIFEDDAKCGICRVQGKVLADMEEQYGIEVLAVSRDGGVNAKFPDALVDIGQLKRFGLSGYPSPTLALVDPANNQVDVIGSGLITADEILQRIYVISEIPVGERY